MRLRERECCFGAEGHADRELDDPDQDLISIFSIERHEAGS